LERQITQVLSCGLKEEARLNSCSEFTGEGCCWRVEMGGIKGIIGVSFMKGI
jgi:hypothetical protein